MHVRLTNVFTQDDDGLGVLLAEAEPGPTVGEAARACPVQAIAVT